MASFRYLNLNKSLSSSSSTGSEMTAPFSTTDITMASHSSECRSKGRQVFGQTSRLKKDPTLAPIVSSCSFHDNLSVHKDDRSRKRGRDVELYNEQLHESNSTSLVTESKKSRSSSSDSSQITMPYEKRNSCRGEARSEKLLSRREAWADHGTDREVKQESRSESKIEYFTSWIKKNPDQNFEERLIRRYAWQGDETQVCQYLDQPHSGLQRKNLCEDLKIEDLEEGSTLCPKPAITKNNYKCEVGLLPKAYGLKSRQSLSDSIDGNDIVSMHRNTIVLPPLSENCKVLGKEDIETPYFPSLAEPFTLESSECPDGLKERLPWPQKVDKSLQKKWRDVAVTLPSVKGTHKKRNILRIPQGMMNRHAHVPLMHLEQPNSQGDGGDENRDNTDKKQDGSAGIPKETRGLGRSVQEVERENTCAQNRDTDLSDANNLKKSLSRENGKTNQEKRKSSESNIPSDEIPTTQKKQSMSSDLVIHYDLQESDPKSVNVDELLTASDVSKISLSSSHVSETFPTSGTDELSEIYKEKCDDLPTFLNQYPHVGKQECTATDTFRDNTSRYDCENQESSELLSKKLPPKDSVTESNGGFSGGTKNQIQAMNSECYIRDLEIVFSTNNKKYMEIQCSNTTDARLKSDEEMQIVSKDLIPMTYPESPTNLKIYETVSPTQGSEFKLQPGVINALSTNDEEKGNEMGKTENGRNIKVHQDVLLIDQVSQNSHHVDKISHQEHSCSFDAVKSEEQSNDPTPFSNEQNECRETDGKSIKEQTLQSQLYCDKTIGFGAISPKDVFIETPDFRNFSLTYNINEVEYSKLREPSCTYDKLKVNLWEKQSPSMEQNEQLKEIVAESKNEIALQSKLQREKTMNLGERTEKILLLNLARSPKVSDTHSIKEIFEREDYSQCTDKESKLDPILKEHIPFTQEQDQRKETVQGSKNEVALERKLEREKTVGLEKERENKLLLNLIYSPIVSDTHAIKGENIFDREVDGECTVNRSKQDRISEERISFRKAQKNVPRNKIVEESKKEVTLTCKLIREKTICLGEGTRKPLLNSPYFPNASDAQTIQDVEIIDREVDGECIAKESTLDSLSGNRVSFTQELDERNKIVEELKNEVIFSLREKTTSLRESPDSSNVPDPNFIKEVEIVDGEIDCECTAKESKPDSLSEEHQKQDQEKEILKESKHEVVLSINLEREKTIILGEEPQNKLCFNPPRSPNTSIPHFIEEEESFNRETCSEYESKLDRISDKRFSFIQKLDQRKECVDESKSEQSLRRTVNCEKTISLEETKLCNSCKQYKPLLQNQTLNESTDSGGKEYADFNITVKRKSDSRKRPYSSTSMFTHIFKRSKKEITEVSPFNSEQNISRLVRKVELCNRLKVKRGLQSIKFRDFEKEKTLCIPEKAFTTAMKSGEKTETNLISLSTNKEIQSVCNAHTLDDATGQNSPTEETTSHEHQSDIFDISVHSQPFESIQQRDVIESNSYRPTVTRRSNSTLQEDLTTSQNSEGNLGQESNGWETLESESGNFETVKNVSEWLEKSQNGKPHDVSIRISYASGVRTSENQTSKESDDPSSLGCTTTSRSTSSNSCHNDSANDDSNSTARDVVLFASSDSRCERRRPVGGGGDGRVSSATRSGDQKRRSEWRTDGRRKVLKRRKKKVVARERSARCRRVLPPPLICAPPPSARRRRHPVFSLPSATPLFGRLATSSESVNSLRMFDGSRKFPRRPFRRYLGRGDFLFKDQGSSENSLINARPSHDKNSILTGLEKDRISKTSGDSSESYHCACETRRQTLVSSCNHHASMLPVSPELTMINELESRRYIRSSPKKRKGSQTGSRSFSEFQTIKSHLTPNSNALGAYFVPVPIIQPRGTWTRRSTPILTPASRESSSSKMHDCNEFSSLQGPKTGVEGHMIAPPLVPMEAVMPMAMALPQFVMPLPWQDSIQPSASCRSPAEGISHFRTEWLSQNHTLSRTGPTVFHFLCLQPMAGKRRK